MDFRKIILTKQNTLQVVYVNRDADTVTVVGGNIVHKDLKEALKALVPHIALLTEQREAMSLSLSELEEQKSWEEKSVFNRMSVNGVTIGEGEDITLNGTRILDRGDVIKVDSPKINMIDDDKYEYKGELQLAIDNVKYEAQLYIEEKKWGLKEGTLDFDGTGDPFKDTAKKMVEVVADDIDAAVLPEKKGKRKKKETVVA